MAISLNNTGPFMLASIELSTALSSGSMLFKMEELRLFTQTLGYGTAKQSRTHTTDTLNKAFKIATSISIT